MIFSSVRVCLYTLAAAIRYVWEDAVDIAEADRPTDANTAHTICMGSPALYILIAMAVSP